MKISARFSVSALALVMLATTGLVGQAMAAEDQSTPRDSIALSPSTQHLTIKGGEVLTGKLTVINDGTATEKFIVYARPYSVKNEQYDPDFQSNAGNTDIYQWVQFGQTTYSLTPGASVEIPYRIQVPSTAAPGGHYGVIFVETQPATSGTDSVMRKKRVGSLLQATVEGTGTQQGRFLSSQISFWQTTPPLVVTDRVENTGNTDFQAGTTLTIKDVFGKVKYQATKDFTIYPGTTRKMTLGWDAANWFGLFHVEQSASVLGKTTSSSQFVLMAPRWLPILLIGIIIVWTIYGLLRHKRRS